MKVSNGRFMATFFLQGRLKNKQENTPKSSSLFFPIYLLGRCYFANMPLSACLSWSLLYNPFTLKSDKHLISPPDVTPESSIKVGRIKEVIIN